MFFNKNNKEYLFAFLSAILYAVFAYFLQRTSFIPLLILWILLFVLFYLFLKKHTYNNTKQLIYFSILFRLVFLFATPNLSQDFYRFIWDGRMILDGLNPYLYLPENLIKSTTIPINQAKELYLGMGTLSANNYTNYPPINQLCFFMAALVANKSVLGSVIVLRIIIILADIGILIFGIKLLKALKLPKSNILLYALNPFIIIEMTGNLHFEPVMLFFLVFALYKLHQKKWIWAAILLGCSVSVKLIPLLFLPLFFQYFTKNEVSRKHWSYNLVKLTCFYLIILTSILLSFTPFITSEFINNYSKSVGLWFGNFEFNASIYYLFREIGYLFRGYNEIAIISKVTIYFIIANIAIITFFRKNVTIKQLILAMLISICLYFFTATTVHPWYLATPLILSIFTSYRFPIIWTLVVILSYQCYANTPWQENLWIVSLEYLILFIFLIIEYYQKNTLKFKNNF